MVGNPSDESSILGGGSPRTGAPRGLVELRVIKIIEPDVLIEITHFNAVLHSYFPIPFPEESWQPLKRVDKS